MVEMQSCTTTVADGFLQRYDAVFEEGLQYESTEAVATADAQKIAEIHKDVEQQSNDIRQFCVGQSPNAVYIKVAMFPDGSAVRWGINEHSTPENALMSFAASSDGIFRPLSANQERSAVKSMERLLQKGEDRAEGDEADSVIIGKLGRLVAGISPSTMTRGIVPDMQGWTATFRAELSRKGHQELDDLLAMHCALYNAALQQRTDNERERRTPGGPPRVTFVWQSKDLTNLRESDMGWSDQDRRIAVETLRRLDRSYQRFFQNLAAGVPFPQAGHPKYRAVRNFRTIAIYAGANRYLHQGKPGRYTIQIKGCPTIHVKANRELPEGQPQEIRVTRKAKRVEVQLVYMVELPVIPEEPTGQGVGVAFGVRQRVTTTQPIVMEQRTIDYRRLNRLNRHMASLRTKALESGRAVWEHRPNSSRVYLKWIDGESRRYKDVRASFAKEWQYITEQNNNAVHRLTTDIVKSFSPGDTIGVEDLRIQSMLKDHRLSKVISEQSWGKVIHALEYKAARAGINFVKVSPKQISSECAACGGTLQRGKSKKIVACPDCGLTLDPSDNTAINVLRRAVFGDQYTPSIPASMLRP